MSTHRVKRIEEEIRHYVSALLLFEMTDPDLKGVTVTRAVVTKDLSLARIYYHLATDAPQEMRERTEQALRRCCGFVRRQLATRLNMRIVPEIEFFYDETEEEVARVESLFSKL